MTCAHEWTPGKAGRVFHCPKCGAVAIRAPVSTIVTHKKKALAGIVIAGALLAAGLLKHFG